MSTINDDDLFLVSRNGTDYKTDASNLMSTIQDTDYMLIGRGDTSYKVSCLDVKEQLGGSDNPIFSAVNLNPVTLEPSLENPNIVSATTNIPLVNGQVPADVDWSWYYYDAATGDGGKTALSSKTNRQDTDSIELPTEAAGKFVGCSVTYLMVTINETERCAVDNFPGLAQVDTTFLIVGGGSSGRGGVGSTGASNSAGGGGGGVITSVPQDKCSGTDGQFPADPLDNIIFVTERSTYSIGVGESDSPSWINGPLESPQANDPPAFNYIANGGDAVPDQDGTSWYPTRGGNAGSIEINGTTTPGYTGQGASRNGAVSQACLQINNACDQDCIGHYYGAGAGAGERPPGIGGDLPALLNGGKGLQTNITGTAFYVAGGAKGTERCNTGGGANGLGRDSYGGGGLNYDPGNPGVVILRYPKQVSIELVSGNLIVDTVESGTDKISTFTQGNGIIKFIN